MKKWKMYLIHNAHTDIGYTQRQEKIIRYHVDYILQAISILDNIHSGKITDCDGFKWQCENYWQVENFYKSATDEQIKSFEKYVKSGEIGLSGNYLNMTELADYDILLKKTSAVKEYAKKTGIEVKNAMTADINGYAWGYTDVLYESGVESLLTDIHTHHGMFPLYKKQIPFYWQSPKGNKILVWIGDHYLTGNDLDLAPYCGSAAFFDSEREAKELEKAKEKVLKYVEAFENEDFPYDFFPVNISGSETDNMPPNAYIARRVNALNKILDGKVTIEIATLDTFFDAVKESDVEIPTYSGDFSDWWADGVASTPNGVKLFREAQRTYDLCKKIDPSGELGDKDIVDDAVDDMMLYAEHTWGYSSSITEPWDSRVVSLEKKKDAFAINANTKIFSNLELVLSKLGAKSINSENNQRFKVINPNDFDFKGTVKLYLEPWEGINGNPINLKLKTTATDEKTGRQFACQMRRISIAFEIEVAMDLKAKEEVIIKISQTDKDIEPYNNHAYKGRDDVEDIYIEGKNHETPALIETDYFKVAFSSEKGIEYIFDKESNEYITDPMAEGAFSGIYELTPIEYNSEINGTETVKQLLTRKLMGRNRRYISTQRSTSKLTNIEIVYSGDVFVMAKLSYSLKGTQFYNVFLKIYKTMPMIEAKVCFHKDSVWDPENVYVALPFITETDGETYIDKSGCVFRPGIDQIPGSCQDFYMLQNGFVKQGKNKDIIVSTLDAPMISFGKREYAPITLCDGNNTKLNKSTPYSWVMNNFWETNFKADLGGFYEFTYTVYTSKHTSHIDAINYCKAINEGLIGFSV